MICTRCLRAARAGLRAGASKSTTNASRSPSGQAMRLHLSTPGLPSVPIVTIAWQTSKHSNTTQQPLLPSHLRSYSTTSVPDSTASHGPPTLERPEGMTEGEAAVWDLLSAEFTPTELAVQDISGGCGSMYSIDITAEKFRGLNMLKQQRVVNSVLADMVKEWHGLQLRTRVP